MDKQIEEISDIITITAFVQAHEINGDENLSDIVATALFNAGYRKIPEGAVVLTRKDYETLCDLAYFGNGEETIRKETAEKFAEMAREAFFGVNCIDIDEWDWYQNKIDEICKEIIGGENENC